MRYKVKVINVEPTNSDNKVKALATIEINNILKIFGIKIIQGDNSLYCSPPTSPYYQDGIKKWVTSVIFEKKLWREIERDILRKYKDINNTNKK